ncbi:MAG TPA: MopE-related protein [Polyangia bacterium]|nr:MopE-related protein [Polyangia bacterium]
MPRTPRLCGRSSLAFALALGGALGCGGGKSSSNTGQTSAALHIMSAPVHAGQVGDQMRYQAVLSQPGAADWTMEQGPHGAAVDQGGNVTWTPDATQGGDQAFTVSATMNGHTVSQSFTVTAASSVTQASAHIDPNDPNGGTVSVDAPLSSVQGAAIQMDPGALPPGDPVAVTISSMQHAPTPAAAQVAGVMPQDLEPVEVGPSGLAFKKPVLLQLPIPDKLKIMPTLAVMTYDYQSGKWDRVKTVSMDKASGVIVAEIQHLSTYVVTPDVPVFGLELGLGGPACAGALVVSAPLVVGFSDVPALSVNGYTGQASTVADVLAGMASGQALQVYTRVKARAALAAGEQSGWLLAAATKQDDGKLKVSVTSDSHAGPFLKVPSAELAATDPELLAWMNGSRADFVFGALGDLSAGAVASAEASLYLVPGGDADRPPPASANAIGTADLTVATLAAAGTDQDCDGAPDTWDPEPAGAAPPVLVGFPGSPVHVAVGAAAPFKISSPQPGVTFAWAASDPSVKVTAAMDGGSAMITPSVPGLFHVTATGTLAGASGLHTWDMIADPAGVMAAAPPPVVAVSASASVVRAGEPVTLTGLGKDAQQAGLTYDWATTDVTTMSATAGQTVVFTATAPGDYPVTCVASNGNASSAPATVTLTVLSATANRPPGMPSVSPLSAVLTHDMGAPVTLALTAAAVDPDGDVLTYDFAPDPSTPATYGLTKSGAAATFTSSTDGVYVFYVTATDPSGARGPWATVKVVVLPALGANPVDMDKDGYPAGFDCNDMDPTIHPGAKEICADNVDQDCDGKDTPAAQCDADGDRFTPAMGDCDDNNPAISPAVVERCDKIDNNCNGMVDEGFGVGLDCANGVGACQVMAKTVCSASFVDVVCGGTPGAPKAETCNGIDDDCNGRVDDVPGGATSTDVANCGGCNVACATLPSSVPACVMGGCVSTCAPGFVDADRNPANGCECKLTNNGVEACDGVDNDCNGVVDDGVGGTYYPGPAGTLGVGVCAAGAELCQGGTLLPLPTRPPKLPSTEVCDGLDNDCNGKVDDGFDFLNDSRNCGGCGITCTAGPCHNGRCPTATTGGDGGVIMVDAGAPPGSDGGAGQGGGGVPASVKACPGPTGGTVCDDLANDHANCGACGHACAATQYCNAGLCTDFPQMSCGTGATVCLDPSGQKPTCTMLMYDPRNCGACGNVCASGTCDGGQCGVSLAQDAGAVAFDAGTAPAQGCPANAPTPCNGPSASAYCANLTSSNSDCGACGITCGPNLVCMNNECAPPATSCGGGLTMCAGGCTSIADDYRNCGLCGQFCDGSCNSGSCQAPGQAPYGSSCSRNGDCAGGLCLDKARFGYPTGFCSSVCDGSLPCGANQVCVGSPTSGGFGACRPACASDADCGAQAPFCVSGACQPDCRTGPACTNGQSCDATGRCVTATQPFCTQPQVTCLQPGGGSYCADPGKDPLNCGGCGRVCGNGQSCNSGVCGALQCGAPATACPSPGGGSFCANLGSDAQNCGACGHVCGNNAICTNGTCQGGGGTYQGLAACMVAGAPVCTNLYSDPANCGACGTVCAAGQGCYSGTCGTAPPPPTCAANLEICTDPTAQKQYCSDPLFDSNNCGKCGVVCASGMGCQQGVCVAQASQDAGATQACAYPGKMCQNAMGPYCANVMGDPANCGNCGYTCGGGQYCQQGVCTNVASPDGGAGVSCPGGYMACYPAAAPAYCADIGFDAQNCGACFKPCPGGWSCQQGACQPAADGGTMSMISCQVGYTACDNVYCADLDNDPANCGFCHNQCAGGCVGGSCELP